MDIETAKANLIKRIEAIEDPFVIKAIETLLDFGEMEDNKTPPPPPKPKRDLRTANKSYFKNFMKKQ